MTTQSRRAHSAAQRQLEAALKAGKMGSWTLDLSTVALEASDSCKANYGRRPDDSFTYSELAAAIHPADVARWRETLETAIANAAEFEIEYRTLWPDRTEHWVLVRGNCFVDATGRTTSLAGVSIDVTARKTAELALQRSERRQQFVVKLSDALRPLADPAAIQATASRVLGEHLGAGRVAYFEVVGTNYVVDQTYVNGMPAVTGRFPTSAHGGRRLATYREGLTDVAHDVSADERLTAEERVVFAELRIGAYIGVPLIKNGVLVGGFTVQVAEPRHWSDDEVALVEETAERTWAAVERARALAAVDESRARFELVSDAAQVGFWFCDLPFDVLIWDHRVKEHFWLPPDATVTIETFYARLHPDDRERTRQAIDASIANRTRYDIEYRTQSDTGEEKWIRAIGRTFYDGDGAAIRFDGVTLDITAQKRAEQALRDNDRRKDQFLAMLAHELRNPLAPIVNAAHVLKHPELDAASQQRARDVIERQAQHLSRIVDDLLDVSRITQQKITLRREVVDLATVIGRAVEANRPIVDARRQQLTVTTGEGALRVDGDVTRLVQVVSNLLNNAAKYTDEGGHIVITAGAEEGEVVLRMRDDGSGIAPELLPRVFDLFTQADATLDRSQGGLGLGLTLVRLLVEMHGGRVEAFSEGLGRGSEFVMRLPRWRGVLAEPAGAGRFDAEPAADQPPLRVLIIEDHVDSAEALSAVLALAGHQVRLAHDGREGLAAALAFAPHLLLCDIGLPGMSGYAVAEAVRATPQLSRMTLIALSGYGQDEDRRRSTAAGFDRHLVKPVDPNAFLALLAELRNRGSG